MRFFNLLLFCLLLVSCSPKFNEINGVGGDFKLLNQNKLSMTEILMKNRDEARQFQHSSLLADSNLQAILIENQNPINRRISNQIKNNPTSRYVLKKHSEIHELNSIKKSDQRIANTPLFPNKRSGFVHWAFTILGAIYLFICLFNADFGVDYTFGFGTFWDGFFTIASILTVATGIGLFFLYSELGGKYEKWLKYKSTFLKVFITVLSSHFLILAILTFILTYLKVIK